MSLPAWSGTPWPTTDFRVDFAVAQDRSTTGQDRPPMLSDQGRTTAPPAGADEDQLDVFGERQRAWDVLAMVFERSLADAAQALEAAGYEPPNLPLFRDDAGNTFYRVQVVDHSVESGLVGAAGVYHSATDCGDPGIAAGSWFGVDAADFVPLTGSMETYLYLVLAHELFHTVQASYPASADAINGCNANTSDYDTVSEGTADAVAGMLARRHWPKYYLKFVRASRYEANPDRPIEVWRYYGATGYLDDETVGLRHYDRSFLDLSRATADERRLAAYTTSSFWFNVMDRYGFAFIDHLLRQPLAQGDWPSLAEWLDGAMRSWQPRLDGLYMVFPHFAAEFASALGSRFPFEEIRQFGPGREIELDPDGGALPEQMPATRDEWREAWIENVLGPCRHVELTPDQPGPVEVRFPLKRLSAGCLDIRWAGFDREFELYVEAEHASLRLIDQVNLGLVYQRAGGTESYCYDVVHPHYTEPLWTCTHEKPFLTNGAQPLVYTKRWSEPEQFFTGEGQRYMAVSNVARDARRTRPFPEDDPLIVRVGAGQTRSADGRDYGPPFSPYKGSPGMALTGFDDATQYGITKAPTPAAMLWTFDVPVEGSDKNYGVSWLGEPPSAGYTGPFKGNVTAPQEKGSTTAVASMLCPRHKDGVVGQVTRYDRDHLWIDIDADLCEMTQPPPADGRFPVVDHLKASLRLPFGWRYDPATAPADIVTPGMEVLIDRHARRVPMVLSGTWQSAGNEGGFDADGRNDRDDTGGPGGRTGSGPGGSSGSAAVLQGGACACSCEELAQFDQRGEASKQSGDDTAKMALAREMMACFSQCQQQYMLCRLGLPDD